MVTLLNPRFRKRSVALIKIFSFIVEVKYNQETIKT